MFGVLMFAMDQLLSNVADFLKQNDEKYMMKNKMIGIPSTKSIYSSSEKLNDWYLTRRDSSQMKDL
jgi:hypothetical protein